MNTRVLVSLILLVVAPLYIGCGASAGGEDQADQPQDVDPATYARRSIRVRELTVQFWRAGADDADVTASLRGRVVNSGHRAVSSVVVAYECTPERLKVKGTHQIGPLGPGESVRVDEVLRTMNLPDSMSYSCKVKTESVEF